MTPMKLHAAILLTLSVVAILPASGVPSKAMAADSAPPSVQDLLRELAPLSADDCGSSVSALSPVDVRQAEDQLFNAVDTSVTDRLNGPTPAQASDAEFRVRSALLAVEHSSSEINGDWPDEDRLHFEILALHPAILARLSYRGQARLVLFSAYDLNRKASNYPGMKWQEVSLDDPGPDASTIDMFPLHRGPRGRVRFLARVMKAGCAGSFGEAYYGYEWSADAGQLAKQIIKIEGAEGLDDAASKHVGKFSTTGKTIQLPYCFFSAVDTWDDPTLCAADSFDLSGDNALFTGRIYNAPDLVVVNSAIQHAQARDELALRGYCASDAVARKLIREIPLFLGAEVLERSKTGPAREKIVLNEGSTYFNLIRRRGEWRLESFRIADGK